MKCGSRVRKSWALWSEDEKKLWIQVVNKMNENGELWTFVAIHLYNSDFIHRSALFFPWHRAFLLEFENSVRAQGEEYACLTLPVWDWAGSNDLRLSRKSGADDASTLWIDDDPYLKDMGGGGQNISMKLVPSPANSDAIISLNEETLANAREAGYGDCGDLSTFSAQEASGPIGPPFSQLRDRTQSCHYPIKFVSCDCAERFSVDGGIVTRTIDMSGKAPGADMANLIGDRSESLAEMLLNATNYADLRKDFAAAHNRVHAALGASMVSMRSPGDPLFIGHHTFSDYIWDLHTKLHGSTYTCEVCGELLPDVDSTIGGVTGFWLGNICNDTVDAPMPSSLPSYRDEMTYGGQAYLEIDEVGVVKPSGVSEKFWKSRFTPRELLDLDDLSYSYHSQLSITMYLKNFEGISQHLDGTFMTKTDLASHRPPSSFTKGTQMTAESNLKHQEEASIELGKALNANSFTESSSLLVVPLLAVFLYSGFAIHRYRRRRRLPCTDQTDTRYSLLSHRPSSSSASGFYYEDIQ